MEQFNNAPLVDFTLNTYRKLLSALSAQGHTFQPYAEFLEKPAARVIILRHDVEARYGNALAFAKIQHEKGIRGTYYFRFLPNHFSKDIIREIAALGHETGYHYDDLSHCNGDHDAAIKRFEANLATLREIAPVKTICMEGAPLSKWDNRDLWGGGEAGKRGGGEAGKRGGLAPHYRDYGIIGEPYFDTDFSQVMYLTDTGRRWDGKASMRDKVGLPPHPLNPPSPFSPSPRSPRKRGTGGQGVRCLYGGGQGVRLHSTNDIIAAANASLLPDQVMFTFHPQRWTDRPLPWLQELVMQNVKNVGKRIVLRFKS